MQSVILVSDLLTILDPKNGPDQYIIIKSKDLHKQFYKNLSFCSISRNNEKDSVIMLASTQDTPKDLLQEKR